MITEQREITINDANIAYTIKRSRRRRRSVSIGVTHDGVLVTAPLRESYTNIERIVIKHGSWILNRLAHSSEYANLAPPDHLKNDPQAKDSMVQTYRLQAHKLFHERMTIYQYQLGVYYKQLKISDQKSQWGNCNRFGVIRLNWRLVLLPLEIIDYVIVHELCHLVHLNHSKSFWRLVEKAVPDYKAKRKALRMMSVAFAW
jgi:predicted metal-dependent hydrolase